MLFKPVKIKKWEELNIDAELDESGKIMIWKFLPSWEDIPDEYTGKDEWEDLYDKFSFNKPDMLFNLKFEKVDKTDAVLHILVILNSYGPPVEYKRRVISYFLSIWN